MNTPEQAAADYVNREYLNEYSWLQRRAARDFLAGIAWARANPPRVANTCSKCGRRPDEGCPMCDL